MDANYSPYFSGVQSWLWTVDDSNAWQETLYLLSNPANAAHLQKSIQELEQGRVFEKTGLF